MRTYLFAIAAITASTVGGVLLDSFAAEKPLNVGTAGMRDAAPSNRLVVHEWGTFTSFSGSNGVPMGFEPDNSDLPEFVYYQEGQPGTKALRLRQAGTVSMETPVIYFYADQPLRASVQVNFPNGWITEWYPFATRSPSQNVAQTAFGGQRINWNVKLLPGETVRFPQEKRGNHYYHARETDAAPLQTEIETAADAPEGSLKGGQVVQREKFLFYRGVGVFPPPVSVRALGSSKVRIKNALGERVDGLVLVSVSDGKFRFKTLGGLDAGKELEEYLPENAAKSSELAAQMVKELTGAGLYEKEALAMVKTWGAAWFGEAGTRLLYRVPRARADELLPTTIDPKPAEMVRVLVGRHDFLTPEQEAETERQVNRTRTAQAELEAVEKEMLKIGRFAEQARQLAQKRLDNRAASR